MSALTQATIIVEAGETSGTLVQAKAALQQGRKLIILENNFLNPSLTWPVKLEEKGAIRAKSYDDIRKHLTPPILLKKIDELTILSYRYLNPEDEVYYLGEYTPRQGVGFSKMNQLILNYKKEMGRKGKSEWHYKEKAIKLIASYFFQSISRT